jgi:EmrB/QacA subfamily drug resistance transporter
LTEGHDRRVTLTVAASFFMLLLDGTILNTSLPRMAVALNVPPLTLSAAITVYLLSGAAVLPLTSWLGDRYGLRRLFVVAIALFTLASLLCGLAQNAPQLVLARALQGFGGGLMMPIGRTLALHRARKEDFIRVAALLTWPALFAPVLGPPLGGLITTYASWRWNFLLNVPLGAMAIVLILRWVPIDTAAQRRPLDRRGAIGAALGLMLVLGGLEWIAHVIGEGAALPALLTTAGGIGLLAWTVRHLRRAPHPVVSLAPLAQPTFAVATAAGGTFAAMCLHSCPFLLPLLFQLALGRDAVSSGALLLPYFLGNLGMKSVTTPILVRFGFRNVMVTAGGCSAAAIAAFGLLSAQTPWAALIALLFFAGCARSMLLTALTSLTFADIPLAQRGAASTLSTVSTQVAATLGVAIGAILLALAQFVHGHHPHLALPDFRVAFVAMGLISALTVIPFWRLARDAGAELIGRTAPRAGG